jgi:hypothetical protein
MTDNPGSLYEKNDDLDLGMLLKNGFRFFKRHGRLILITSATGLFCGYVLHKSLPKHYTTRMVLESSLLTNMEQNELVENWDLLLNSAGYPLLKKEFNCSQETVQSIGGLSLEALTLLTDGTNSFALEISINDTAQLKNIQEALLTGFGNNDFVRQKVALRKENLESLIRQANGEMAKLDSTKDFIEGLTRGDRNGNDRLILDVSNISKEKLDLGEKLGGFKQKLKFSDAVQLVQGATPPKGPKPGLLTFLGLGLATGFLIGYFFAFIKGLVRSAKQKSF